MKESPWAALLLVVLAILLAFMCFVGGMLVGSTHAPTHEQQLVNAWEQYQEMHK